MGGTEVIDNAISRKYIDEEIDKLQEELKSNNDAIWNLNKKAYKYLAYIRRTVLDAPSVQPKMKMGKWIEHFNEDEYECDRCHEWSDCQFDYCPNCGAKMEVER